MRESTRNLVTTRHAWAIAGTSLVALLALMIVLPAFVVPNRPAAAWLVAILGLTTLLCAGSVIAGFVIERGVQVSWGQFVLLVIDCALLPLVVPFGLLITAVLVWVPVQYLAGRWFGDLHGAVLAMEYASFAWLLLLPYAPLLWPIIHRNRIARNNAERARGGQATLSLTVAICFYLAATTLVLLTKPTVVFVCVFVASWVGILAIYRSFVLPRAPRYLCRF